MSQFRLSNSHSQSTMKNGSKGQFSQMLPFFISRFCILNVIAANPEGKLYAFTQFLIKFDDFTPTLLFAAYQQAGGIQ